MIRLSMILVPLVFLTSCASIGPVPKSDKYQTEMTLHKTRADLEELKHDLHTQKMSLAILEGKMLNHEDQMISIKKETFDLHQTKLEGLSTQMNALEHKFASLNASYQDISKLLIQLEHHTEEMSKALIQNKEKIREMEKLLSINQKSQMDISKLKKEIDKIVHFFDETKKLFLLASYRVKMGDTLDSIAKECHTTVETLKTFNTLESDKLTAGQFLHVPTPVEFGK